MYILNKHVRWRKDKKHILICDCKRLLNLKIPLTFQKTIKKFEKGIKEENLKEKERLLFLDFKKLKLLSRLLIRPITKKEFSKAMTILDQELKNRIRKDEFLFEKFRKFPQFFIGIFLDNEIVGVLCGFPREDYLLIGEIAVDSRFQGRGLGRKLVEYFEKIAVQEKYNRINAGARNNAINFYNTLNYKPFLLIQYKKNDYLLKDFKNLNIKQIKEDNKYKILEVETKKINLDLLKKLRKKYPKAHFQYIFTKS